MKVKVKIFPYSTETHLEEAVNAFIVDKDIVDIKFAAGADGCTAMVLYKESEWH